MGILDENELATGEQHWPSDRLRLVMLQQMAEALEDEANGLNQRARSLEEEEFLLSTEVQERLVEISRLNLRLDGLRSERDSLLDKIETLRREAIHIKEEVLDNEEEIALDSLAARAVLGDGSLSVCELRDAPASRQGRASSPMFFRRTTVTDFV
jgi:predicted nuclease with TOPRIM domain